MRHLASDATLVSVVTYGDSHIHHIVYGIRNYPYGYYATLPAIIVFILTYIVNANIRLSFDSFNIVPRLDKNKRPFLTFLLLIIPIFILIVINFQPEFPHMCIFQFSLGYALVIALTVHTHNYDINFGFLDEDISDKVKIERVKLEYETWFRLIAAIVAAYCLINLYIFSQLIGLVEQITMDRGEQLLTMRIVGFFIYLGAFFSFFWIIELIKKSQFIKDQLLRIR